MTTLLTVLTAIDAILLTLAVLIQNPKGGGIDSTFGGVGAGASQVFGAAKSADFIEKATWYLAIGLFVLAILTSLSIGSPQPAGPDIIMPE